MLSDVLQNFDQFKSFYLGLRDKRNELDETNTVGIGFFQTCLKQLRLEYPDLYKQLEETEETLD